ncbi:MAG TPA: hypothetical protein VN260_10660 [Dissulfurispiraceae bacterium]|nr:hypothetical protein [Dissulfurispiraceae bacterium]
MFGAYREGGEQLPRVLHISVARYNGDLPKKGESLRFFVSIHEEGTGITWQQNVTVEPEGERYFLDATQDLYLWSLNAALTPKTAFDRVRGLGSRLYDTFIGTDGSKVLESIVPTAVLLNADETILKGCSNPCDCQSDAGPCRRILVGRNAGGAHFRHHLPAFSCICNIEFMFLPDFTTTI